MPEEISRRSLLAMFGAAVVSPVFSAAQSAILADSDAVMTLEGLKNEFAKIHAEWLKKAIDGDQDMIELFSGQLEVSGKDWLKEYFANHESLVDQFLEAYEINYRRLFQERQAQLFSRENLKIRNIKSCTDIEPSSAYQGWGAFEFVFQEGEPKDFNFQSWLGPIFRSYNNIIIGEKSDQVNTFVLCTNYPALQIYLDSRAENRQRYGEMHIGADF